MVGDDYVALADSAHVCCDLWQVSRGAHLGATRESTVLSRVALVLTELCTPLISGLVPCLLELSLFIEAHKLAAVVLTFVLARSHTFWLWPLHFFLLVVLVLEWECLWGSRPFVQFSHYTLLKPEVLCVPGWGWGRVQTLSCQAQGVELPRSLGAWNLGDLNSWSFPCLACWLSSSL